MDINAKVFAAFQAENKEQLEVLRLIAGVAVKGGEAAFDEALRLAHTMKAGARVCGLNGIQELAHRLETLFAQIRDKSLGWTGEIATAITNSLDAIEDAMASVTAGKSPGNLTQALDGIARALKPKSGAAVKSREGTRQRVLAAFQSEQKEHLEGIRTILAKGAEANGGISEVDLNEILRFAHTLKGGARISGLPAIETLSHQLESAFARIRQGTLK
ncbi:MAG: Hpt domain-containing protein, partial [Chthoniobacteraceae bacterium]